MKKILILFYIVCNLLLANELITPIPTDLKYSQEKAILGMKLFNDTRLSRDNTISCATCHILEMGGDDNLELSFGVNGQKGKRNSPTVLNAVFNNFQFWDASAESLQEQVLGPIHNPVEMDSNFKDIIKKLKKDSSYIKEFATIYKDGITQENIVDAIVEFEKTLITPNSKFDDYLKGHTSALTKDETEGYFLFKEYGCISCHNGINIGGNLMQKLGVIKKYTTSDFGRYNITKKDDDKFYFKVPSLRNVELTAPYFHDGKVATIKDAIQKMLDYQVGYEISDKDIDKIGKFLKTLTGKTPEFIVKQKNR